MNPEDVLKEFGLTPTETKAYLALLKLGETSVPEVVKKTGLHKPNAYNALNSLEKKGLVSQIRKEHKLFYSALNPEKFFGILESKKEDLNSVFPMLKQFYQAKKTKREVNVLSGMEGLKTVFNDMENIGKDVFTVGSSLQLFSIMEHRAIQLLKKLKKKNISVKAVIVDKKETREQINELQKQVRIGEARFYQEKYFSPTSFTTYGDRVVLQMWEDEPLIIWIKDGQLAKTFRNYFEMIWKAAKK
ncbi:MAG: helix-turn-helix domain-containing protein [Candidatus Aenigmatarchaeota archaeon]